MNRLFLGRSLLYKNSKPQLVRYINKSTSGSAISGSAISGSAISEKLEPPDFIKVQGWSAPLVQPFNEVEGDSTNPEPKDYIIKGLKELYGIKPGTFAHEAYVSFRTAQKLDTKNQYEDMIQSGLKQIRDNHIE